MVATKEFRWVKASERMPPTGKTVKVRGGFTHGVVFHSETMWLSGLNKWGGIPSGVAVEEWEEEVPPPPPLKERARAYVRKWTVALDNASPPRDILGRDVKEGMALINGLLAEIARLEDGDDWDSVDEDYDYPPYD
jgi:hypothetical protein